MCSQWRVLNKKSDPLGYEVDAILEPFWLPPELLGLPWLDPEDGCGLAEGVPTADLPTKIAPGSIESDAALMSPTSSAFAFSSTLSETSMLP